MNNLLPAFDILHEGDKPHVGYSKSSGHLIFYVKMDFSRKNRWVKDGNLTPAAIDSNFGGVVSGESLQILFTYAALNGQHM